MNNEQIREVAIANGFKLKEQPSGEMDLNPYVYDFARALGLVDVRDSLPEPNTRVLVRYHAHFDDEPVVEFGFCSAFFMDSGFDVRDQHFYNRRKLRVTHWMLEPNLPSEVDND